jgi:hypothetical protein
MRQPFYQVAPEHYLVPIQPGSGTQSPEEEVRQWCAFELIREYGVTVNELVFEAQVQIGSRPKRIDILVRRHGKPWLVVECKAQGHKQEAKALVQAESYATSPSVRAEFVLYTNGRDWVVRRRISEEWIPTPDLPRQHDSMAPAHELARMLYDLENLKPLLVRLETPVEGPEAKSYLHALQVFFHGENFFTHRIDKELRELLDMVLRVVSTRDEADGDEYAQGKLRNAIALLNTFLASARIGNRGLVGEKDTSWQMMDTLFFALSPLLETLGSIKNYNSLAARCALTFVAYGRSQRRGAHFPRTPHALHLAVRDFLELSLAVSLNAKLPDPLDDLGMADLRSAAR